MNVDEALARVRARSASVRAAFHPLTKFGGRRRSSFPVTAITTDAIPAANAVVLLRYFLAHRAEIGLTPILVEDRAWPYLRAYKEGWKWPRPDQVPGDLAEIEEIEAGLRSPGLDDSEVASLDAALDAIEGYLGGSLDSRTELLDWDDMQAVEAGERPDDSEQEDPPETASAEATSAGLAEDMKLPWTLQLAPPGLPSASPDVLFDVLAASGRHHLVLFDCPSQLTLYFLGYGNWNDCPAPVEHAAFWSEWNARHGAEVVQVGPDEVVGLIARPAATRLEVARLAAEMVAYSRDNLAEGVAPLIGTLFRSHAWSSWWD